MRTCTHVPAHNRGTTPNASHPAFSSKLLWPARLPASISRPTCTPSPVTTRSFVCAASWREPGQHLHKPGEWVVRGHPSLVTFSRVAAAEPAGQVFLHRPALITKAGTFVLEAVNLSQGKALEVDPAEVAECYRVVGVCFIAEDGGG